MDSNYFNIKVKMSEIQERLIADDGQQQTGVNDVAKNTALNIPGRIDHSDVEYLLRYRKNVLTLLKDNGDFRSAECVEFIKASGRCSYKPALFPVP